MKAAYLFGAGDLRLIEREPDNVGPEDVRIAVSCSGICGTEIHLYSGMVFGDPLRAPRRMGHEFAGRVVEVGAKVTTLSPGDRVTAIPNAACGRCTLCKQGRAGVCTRRSAVTGSSWAPEIVAPAHNVYRLPDDVSDRLGALTEPLACAVRAVDRSDIRSGERVCIIGAGPIGLFLLAVARASGASQVIVSEPHAFRRDLALRLGADLVIDPTATSLVDTIREYTDGLGADVVFEAVGLPPTIKEAIAATAPGGTVMIVGVTDADALAAFAPQELFFKELTIRAVKGPTHAVDRAIRWLTKLDLDPVITHTFALDDATEAIEFARSGMAGKVYLRP